MEQRNKILSFVLGVIVGGGMLLISGGGSQNIYSRICPIITNKNLCEMVGCVADPVNIMPAPGTPGWFCEARDRGSK